MKNQSMTVEAQQVIKTFLREINCGQADRFKKGIMGFNAMAGIIKKKYPEARFTLLVEGVEMPENNNQ